MDQLAPPSHIIECVRQNAMKSPCAKSKRGAVIYGTMHGDPISLPLSAAWNTPPSPFTCGGSDACRDACARICVHAERGALDRLLVHPSMSFGTIDYASLDLVHAKVIGDQVVATGKPSCVSCSKEILSVGIAGVWLYERFTPEPTCDFEYRMPDNSNTYVRCALKAEHIAFGVPRCKQHVDQPHDHEACVSWQIRSANDHAVWKHYTAFAFHLATLVNLGLPTHEHKKR